MKRAIFNMIALTMLFTSCIEDVTTDDDGNDNQKSTVSFKVNGTPYNLSREDDDGKGNFPAFVVANDPEEGLVVQFSPDGYIIFDFAGAYLASSSQNYKDGHMSYADNHKIGTGAIHEYNSYSWDECNSDSFSFQIQKQHAGLDYMPFMYRFTGTFSGRLVYYHGTPGDGSPSDPCANPEFLEITDGKFSVTGLNDYKK